MLVFSLPRLEHAWSVLTHSDHIDFYVIVRLCKENPLTLFL